MRCPWRYYLLADAAGAAWVRAAAALLGDGGAAELDTCTTGLSPKDDPAALPVAWCCSFAATEQQRARLEAVEAQIPPGVTWCRCGAKTRALLATNHPGYAARLAAGETFVFDLPAALAALGLTFRKTPE